jgi:hypothetical protein
MDIEDEQQHMRTACLRDVFTAVAAIGSPAAAVVVIRESSPR